MIHMYLLILCLCLSIKMYTPRESGGVFFFFFSYSPLHSEGLEQGTQLEVERLYKWTTIIPVATWLPM